MYFGDRVIATERLHYNLSFDQLKDQNLSNKNYMKKGLIFLAILFLTTLALALSNENQKLDAIQYTDDRNTPAADSDEAFTTMMQVLTHKRCVNCHPAGNQPLQGEDSHLHNFGVQRGPDDHGVVGLQCGTCHQKENNDFSGVPGAPEWAVAPLSMKWEGLSRVEIARSMLDRNRNGNRSLEDLVKHLTEHKLVLWAWEPGVDASGTPREKPPIPVDEYIAAVKEWAKNGAIIPES